MRLSIISASVVLFGLSVTSASGEEVSLKLKFRVGDAEKLAMTMETEQTIKDNSRPAPIQQEFKMGMDVKLNVMTADVSGATVEMTFDRMAIQMSALGHDVKFDSNDPASSEKELRGLTAIIGAKLTLRFDSDGKVDKVEGVDEMKNRLAASATGALAAQLLEQSFNPDQLKHSFNSNWAETLPTGTVAIGGTWQSNLSLDAGKKIVKMSIDNKLVSIDEQAGHKLAHIEFNGTGKVEESPTRASKLKVDELTVKGTKSFDLDRGFFSVSEMEQKLKGTYSLDSKSLKVEQTATIKMTVAPESK